MPALPNSPVSGAPLASNARPTPEIFALRVQAGLQVAEGCAEGVRSQVAGGYALAEAGVAAQPAEVCVLAEVAGAQAVGVSALAVEVVGAQGAEEVDADDRKTKQFY